VGYRDAFIEHIKGLGIGYGQSECFIAVVRVVKVRRYTKEVPVYDLTVRKDHCYYANGVLVSNSDAFGLLCVVVEDLFVKPKRQDDHYVEYSSWMG
jgi:hypothetical protein